MAENNDRLLLTPLNLASFLWAAVLWLVPDGGLAKRWPNASQWHGSACFTGAQHLPLLSMLAYSQTQAVSAFQRLLNCANDKTRGSSRLKSAHRCFLTWLHLAYAFRSLSRFGHCFKLFLMRSLKQTNSCLLIQGGQYITADLSFMLNLVVALVITTNSYYYNTAPSTAHGALLGILHSSRSKSVLHRLMCYLFCSCVSSLWLQTFKVCDPG